MISSTNLILTSLLIIFQELEIQAKTHGIAVSEFTWQPITPTTVINTYIKGGGLNSMDPVRKVCLWTMEL